MMFLLTFLLLCVCAANAQTWTEITSLKSGIMLDVSAPSENSVYVPVFDNGVGAALQHTADGGKTWNKTNFGGAKMPMLISCVNFMNTNEGVISGTNVLRTPILSTKDAGKTWTPGKVKGLVSSSTAIATFGKTQVIVGTYGKVIGYAMSRDGGASWELGDINEPQKLPGFAIQMASENTWYIAGGMTPSDPPSPDPPINSPFRAYFEHRNTHMVPEEFRLRDALNGTYATIMKTNDGGKTWTRVFSDDTFCMAEISCPDENTCYATGGGDDPKSIMGSVILKTTDGGKTWAQIWEQHNTVAAPIHFVSGTEGYVGIGYAKGKGAEGAVLHTIDGGKTWKSMATFKNHYPVKFDFLSNNSAWGVTIPAVQGADPTVLRFN